jgi:hypothetical protein
MILILSRKKGEKVVKTHSGMLVTTLQEEEGELLSSLKEDCDDGRDLLPSIERTLL